MNVLHHQCPNQRFLPVDFVHSNQVSDENVSLIIIYKAKSKDGTS